MASKILRFLPFLLLPLSAVSGWAANMPDAIEQFLYRKARPDLVVRWNQIPQPSPEEMTADFKSQNTKLLGAGFGGIAYKTDNNEVYKFSYSVFSDLDWVRPHWAEFRALPVVASKDFPLLKQEGFVEHAIRRKSNEIEALGTLLWSIYSPEVLDVIPTALSRDGLSYKRKFVAGTPLNEILQTPLHPLYGKALWKRIIEIQRLAEYMLFETGVQVDLANPANLIVRGTRENPVVELIDHEFLKPSPQAIAHYRAMGIVIPNTGIAEQFELISWPLMPDHIVVSRNWSLSFEQAVEFLELRYRTNRLGAIQKLSQMTPLEFKVPKTPYDDSHVRQAKAMMLEWTQRCAALLFGE